MHSNRLFGAALIGAVLLLGGCASTVKDPPVVATGSTLTPTTKPVTPPKDVPAPGLMDPDRVVARVNGDIITVRTIQASNSSAFARLGTKSELERRQFLEGLTLSVILNRLLLDAARHAGVKITKKDLDRIRAMAEKQAKSRGTTLLEDLRARGIELWQWKQEQVREYLLFKYLGMASGVAGPESKETRAVVDTYVGPAEMRRWYERHASLYHHKETAKVQGISIWFVDPRFAKVDPTQVPAKAKAYAESIVRRARSGESFDALMKEVQGGPLPNFAKPFPLNPTDDDPQQPEYVKKFAFHAKVGTVSDPIPTPGGHGYLILKLVQRHRAETPSFAKVQDQVRGELSLWKRRLARAKVELDLLKRAVISPAVYRRILIQMQERTIREVMDQLSD